MRFLILLRLALLLDSRGAGDAGGQPAPSQSLEMLRSGGSEQELEGFIEAMSERRKSQ